MEPVSRVDDLEARVKALEQRLTEYVEMFNRALTTADQRVDEVNKRITAAGLGEPLPIMFYEQPPTSTGAADTLDE